MSTLTAEQVGALVDQAAADLFANHPDVLAEVLWGIALEEPGSDIHMDRGLVATVAAAVGQIAGGTR